jgi:hypothetical protein
VVTLLNSYGVAYLENTIIKEFEASDLFGPKEILNKSPFRTHL